MFLEGPSTRTMIEGFMIKRDRTFSEFESLIGFNLFEIDEYKLASCSRYNAKSLFKYEL